MSNDQCPISNDHWALDIGHSTLDIVAMPNIGAYHPIIVHFAIALLVLGVIFRWVSLTGRAPFTAPAAASLLILGTVAAYLAVQSGADPHGPVERIPGVRQAVMDHEDAGHWARTVVLVVALLEIGALFAKRRSVRIRSEL